MVDMSTLARWKIRQRLLEPLYSRLRKLIPIPGGIDFTPLIVLFAIIALRIVIINNFQ